MSFLAPLFLAGAAAAVVPLVLHLLKRQPEARVKFAAVKLLRHAPVEHTERRRLRELLLLALRVAAIALLAVAFARPFFASGVRLGSAGVTLVAIDRSASLSAPGQMEKARRLAKDLVAKAPAGDLVGVVAFADTADVMVAPTADRALALAAIDAVQPGYGATRYRGALATAARAMDGRRGTLVLVTDLQASGWDVGDTAAVPESARVAVADVGGVAQNLSVDAVRLDGDRIVASVRNAGARARETRVRLALDGRAAGDIGVTLPPGSSTDVALGSAGRATTAAVSVDDAAGIQADNVRYAVVDRADRPAVLVVTATGDLGSDAFYLQQALTAAAAGGGASFDVTGASAASLSGWSAARLSSEAAVILASTQGLELRGREALASYVGAGGGLLVAAGPGVDGAVAGDLLGAGAPLRIVVSTGERAEARALAPADVRHPVFRTFEGSAATLGLVTFQHVARVGGPSCQAIARFTSGEAALLDCGAGQGRALVFASDLNDRWNDFPLHATFVPFVHEMIAYVSSARPRAGDYLVGDVPAGIPAAPGIAALPESGAAARRIAVNVDPRESDLARVSPAEFQAAVMPLKDVAESEARVEATGQEDRQHLWEYALALTLVVLAIEGLVASRTA